MTEKKQEKIYKKYDAEFDSLDFLFSYNDDETKKIRERLNGSTSVTEEDLRQVSLWKLGRVLSVTEDTLTKLNVLSVLPTLQLEDDCAKAAITSLVESQGIGFPMASAILKFIRPSVFPIIDVRAYRALTGKKIQAKEYSYELYLTYAKQVSSLAQVQGRPLSEIDEQLYCFDQKHNGKI